MNKINISVGIIIIVLIGGIISMRINCNGVFEKVFRISSDESGRTSEFRSCELKLMSKDY